MSWITKESQFQCFDECVTTESWNIVLPWITNGRTRTIPRRNIVKRILLFEVWIPSVSIYCGSNLFHAWTWILCLHFRDDSISGSFVGVGQKVKIFTRKRLDAATRGSDPWKRKITIKFNLKYSLVTPLAHPRSMTSISGHTEMSHLLYLVYTVRINQICSVMIFHAPI